MTRQEIARLICKSFGLFFGAYAVVCLWALPATAYRVIRGSHPLEFEPNNYALLWSVLMPFVAYASTASVFWIGADWLAGRMVPPDPAPVTLLTISTADITAIVFAACGIFIFVGGFAEMTSIVASYLYYRMGPERDMSGGSVSDFLSNYYYYDGSIGKSIARIAVGLALMMGSRSIVGLFRRMRTWGLEARDQTNDSGEPS